MWSGAAGTLLLIPLVAGQVYGYASATAGGSVAADPQWLRSTFAGYPAPARQAITSALAEPSSLYHSPVEEVRLESWPQGRVVLIGDAAHATAPVWAQGAALAAEDALVLAELLASGQDWASVGAAFERRRRDRVEHVQRMTDRLSPRRRTARLVPRHHLAGRRTAHLSGDLRSAQGRGPPDAAQLTSSLTSGDTALGPPDGVELRPQRTDLPAGLVAAYRRSMGDVVAFRRRPERTPRPVRRESGQPGSEQPGSTRRSSRHEPLWRELVGEVLHDVRIERSETQRAVADRAGISVQYLSEIERGRKEPSSEMLAAVGGALGLTLVDLTRAVGRRLLRTSGRPTGPVALRRPDRPSGPLLIRRLLDQAASSFRLVITASTIPYASASSAVKILSRSVSARSRSVD